MFQSIDTPPANTPPLSPPVATHGPDAVARSVASVHRAHQAIEGDGLPINRSLPARGFDADPFLLLDHFGPVHLEPGIPTGVPAHPHRGFQTVTYLLDGYLTHRDSLGHTATLGPGDLQWMTAGSGIIHSELTATDFAADGGVLHGFQIWVNLPARLKMTDPGYQDLTADQVPMVRVDEGRVQLRVVAGQSHGLTGPITTHTPVGYVHATLAPGGAVDLPVPRGHNGLVYVFGGSAQVGGDTGEAVTVDQLAALADGDYIHLSVPESATEAAEVLLLSGAPIGEPVARYGPFVMNTEAEIQTALADYRAGRLAPPIPRLT